MPSVITHVVVATALGQAGKQDWRKNWRFWCIAVLSSILPDIDVIGFRFGIRYGDVWGHRGMTHSLLFAAATGILLAASLGPPWHERWKQALLLSVITASHGVLDALTNGGLGVAFFSPFNLHRYFFSWRPILVSPIGAHRFFSARGAQVLWSEMFWVWIPALLIGVLFYGLRAWKARLGVAQTAKHVR